MWPFKRKQSENSNVPTEVQEYYQAEQRERMWVAWLLAFVTLVVTVGVVLGLFFGGRAIYRKAKHKTTPVATVNQPQSTSSDTKADNQSSGGSSNTGSAPTSDMPKSTPDSSSKGSGSTNTKTAQPSLKSNEQTAITDTGPGETAAVGFIGATAIGFGFYELRLRRKLN